MNVHSLHSADAIAMIAMRHQTRILQHPSIHQCCDPSKGFSIYSNRLQPFVAQQFHVNMNICHIYAYYADDAMNAIRENIASSRWRCVALHYSTIFPCLFCVIACRREQQFSALTPKYLHNKTIKHVKIFANTNAAKQQQNIARAQPRCTTQNDLYERILNAISVRALLLPPGLEIRDSVFGCANRQNSYKCRREWRCSQKSSSFHSFTAGHGRPKSYTNTHTIPIRIHSSLADSCTTRRRIGIRCIYAMHRRMCGIMPKILSCIHTQRLPLHLNRTAVATLDFIFRWFFFWQNRATMSTAGEFV